jgi:hypothetical protein
MSPARVKVTSVMRLMIRPPIKRRPIRGREESRTLPITLALCPWPLPLNPLLFFLRRSIPQFAIRNPKSFDQW